LDGEEDDMCALVFITKILTFLLTHVDVISPVQAYDNKPKENENYTDSTMTRV
jgi:hypothetical protein